MTSKDFLSLGKQLLPAMPGFAIKGPLMFLPPVDHTLRGLCFESHSHEARFFYVQMFFQLLCVPTNHVVFTFGKRLGGGNGKRWDADDPSLGAGLTSAIQKEALPFLAALRTPKDTAAAARLLTGESKNPNLHQAIAYALARAGETTAATDELDNLLSLSSSAVAWERDIASRAQMLRAKLVENPADAQQQLETWESETAKNLGLEKFR